MQKFVRAKNIGMKDLLQFNLKQLESNIKIAEFQSEIVGNNGIVDEDFVEDNNNKQSDGILDFKCPICMMTTLQPQECSKCQVFFCVDCSEAMKTKNTFECPICRNDLQLNQLNRILLNILREQKMTGCPFKDCDRHNKTMKYHELMTHLTTGDCQNIQVQCPLECGLKFKIQDLEGHLNICDKMQFNCQNCGEILSNEKNVLCQHDCSVYLKQQIEFLQQRYENLKIEKIEQEGMYLNLIDGLEQSLVDKDKQTEEMKQKLQMERRVFARKFKLINYFAFKSNSTVVVMIHNKPLRRIMFEQIKSIYKLKDEAKWRWKCDANQYKGCFSGQTEASPYGQDMNEEIYNCPICTFDLCKKCYKAYKDIHHHKLTKITFKNLVLIAKEYQSGWRCDAAKFKGCVKNSPWNDDPKTYLFHNPDSRFNLCEKCVDEYKSNKSLIIFKMRENNQEKNAKRLQIKQE
eukprot:403334971